MHRLLSAKHLYLIGGCALSSEREPIAEIERIRVEKVGKGHVRIIAENYGQLAVPRRAPTCFLAENREILVAGGCLGPNNHTNSMELLRILETSSSKIPQITSEILAKNLESGASCSAFDPYSSANFKPIFGGFEAHSCLDDVQIIDFSENFQCRNLAAKKLPKIKNAQVLEVKNAEFLIFGGWEDETRTSGAIRRIIFNADFTDFEVHFEGFLPYPVEGHSLIKNGSQIYLIGGFDGCFVIDTIIKYDMETRKSEILPCKLSEKRENHVSAVLSNTFLVVAAGWNSRNAMDSVEVYEFEKDGNLARCQVDGKLNTARNRPAGVGV